MIVGTAGHIDHGKTALVKALTGVDADRLKEEKARGITIDLGYAYSDLGDGRQLGFVDVPGHERFVHNMLAGATGIDAALLVVSAAEGIKPQTVEHLQIMDLLGLDRGLVALTKSDLVNDDELLERMAEVETLLSSTSLAGAEIIPVSAMTGHGRRRAQGQAADAGRERQGRLGLCAARRRSLLPAVGRGRRRDRHGACRRDQGRRSPAAGAVGPRGAGALAACPESRGRGRPCRRALRAQSQRRAAVKEAVKRGDWVVSPELQAPTDRIDVELKVLASEKQPLKHWARCISISARRTSWAGSPCSKATGGAGRQRPGAARARGEGRRAGWRPGDPARSLGHAHDRRRARGRSLRAAAQPPHAAASRRTARAARPNEDVLPALLREETGFVDLARFGVSRNLRPAEVERLLAEAGGTKVAGFGFLAERLAAARADIAATLKAFHESNADALGLPPERLRVEREEALAAGGIRRPARSGGGREERHDRRLAGSPAGPFAEARRQR